MKKYIFRISILNSIIISYVIGLFLVIGWTMIAAISSIGEYGEVKDIAVGVVAIPLWGGFVGALFVYPIVLAAYQLAMLILETDKTMTKTGVGFDQIVIWYGLILEFLYITQAKYTTYSYCNIFDRCYRVFLFKILSAKKNAAAYGSIFNIRHVSLADRNNCFYRTGLWW